MNRVKSESDWEMPDPDQIDSPSHDDNSARASPRRRAGTQLKKGPWTKSEDAILEAYVKKHGVRNWNVVQKDTGLQRCGKSCRLRWTNHLRPDLKKGTFTKEELNLIIKLHYDMGNKWAQIAAYLPGRTDNEIKNYWNTRIKKCQRTNTPIYPANIRLHASNGDQLESSDFNFREKLANDLVQANGLSVPNFTWGNHIDDGDILSYAPQLPLFSMSDLLASNFGSENYGFMNQVNQAGVLRESGFPFHVVNTTMNGKFDGSHAFSNGTYSASRSTNGPSKMGLPSFQYTESDPNCWYTCARTCAMPHANFADFNMHPSAAILTVEFDSLGMTPSNTGPLEELLPEAHALSPVGNQQQSVCSSSPSVGTPCGTMMESPELNIFERDTDFRTLINGCLSAPRLCPSSLHEFQCSDFSSVAAPSFAFGSSEPTVPQYDQGYSHHSEDSGTDAFPHWTVMPAISQWHE